MSTRADAVSNARQGEPPRGVLDRALSLFADVRGGEGVTAVLLMLNIFLLLAAYYLLKTIREPLILTVQGGAEVKSYSAAAIAGLLMILVPVYSALASRVSRVPLINGVTAFFILCLVAFFFLNQAGVAIGIPFFIWVGIFNLMVIAQLWAFANDVYTVDQGKRLFAIVGFGASLGAIAGSFFTGKLVSQYGPYPFLIAAAVLLGLCMLLTNLVNAREKAAKHEESEGETEGDRAERSGDSSVKGRSGFALVFADRYLLLIAVLMLLSNLVNTTGEYILGKTVVANYMAHAGAAAGGLDEKKIIGEFYGNYFTWVNVISAILQAFVVSRILKYLGVRTALLVLPFVALFGYLSMAFIPLVAFIRGAKIAENSLDYSVQNTTRNALYLPTSREAKYKAKQANDTFFVRLGDLASAGLVFAGTTWLAFGPRQFALTAVGLVAVWLVVAFVLGKRFQSLAHTN
ncbi:MAG TPA: Npt1/Npt2 family nucleotide transporter [Candidatus Eisenbacteria bacterium]|jgi:AAA family ATP:ADP antiporter|nr:Npt1/Npt2 family nucleotide transporter [Candidatus Eisenbacteria bacterium]